MPYKDPEKRRAWQVAYYRAHVDRSRIYNAKYRSTHALALCPHGRRALERNCSICSPRRVYGKWISDEKRKFGLIPDDFMSWELFETLVQQNCFWCGRSPEEARGMGIDRMDNTLPHVSTNIKPACADCNMMRRSLTPEVFLANTMRIAKFQEGKCKTQ